MRKTIILFCLILAASIKQGFAQDSIVNDLLNLQLPPLETLFEGAHKSSMVEFYEYRMEGEELTLKTEKRKWLSYFNGYASYQYGVMGLNNYTNIGAEFPVVYQYSASDQIWYNAGVSLRFTLEDLFDRKNKIRRQQLKIYETLKERDMWYDEQKIKIIELYVKAQELLNNLKYVIEMFTFSDVNYRDLEKEYIMGSITAHTLSIAKGQQVQAFLQLERVKSELNMAILKLEILSSTKIINR